MKTLTNLSAIISDTNFTEPPVYHHNCGETFEVPIASADGSPLPRKGIYHRFTRTGPGGLIFSNGKVSIVIPKDELWKLAEKAEPLLAVPKTLEVPKAVLV